MQGWGRIRGKWCADAEKGMGDRLCTGEQRAVCRRFGVDPLSTLHICRLDGNANSGKEKRLK